LNQVFGFNWDLDVLDKQMLDDEVVVMVRLTVRTPNGQTITKTQFGGADIERYSSGGKSGKPLSVADNYKAAVSDALKKCASLLGIGLDVYGREHYGENAPEPEAPRQQKPIPIETARKADTPYEAMVGVARPKLLKLGLSEKLADQLLSLIKSDLTVNGTLSSKEECNAYWHTIKGFKDKGEAVEYMGTMIAQMEGAS
jgi:hypothetical protein